MWSIIEQDKFENFINTYPALMEEKEIFKLHESGDKIFLPRLFYKNYPHLDIKLYDPPMEIEKINVEVNITPRKEQIPLLNHISKLYATNHSLNGIIKCFCGFGKTACTIYLACKLGLKTLFIVDKDSLLKQWIQEIIKFTNLDSENIGLIKGEKFVTDNKPFTMATVQTLVSKLKRRPKYIYQQMKEAKFGLVVFDEVHNTNASEMYAKSSVLMCAPNILGLSATPFKFGGQEILMKNVVGEILYNENNYKLMPQINFHFYKSGLDKYRGVLSRLDFVQSKAFYNNKIIESKSYFNLILKIVKEDLNTEHRILLLCWTEKQLKMISDYLTENGIENRQFYSKQRTFDPNDKVMVCTYRYAGTGNF